VPSDFEGLLPSEDPGTPEPLSADEVAGGAEGAGGVEGSVRQSAMGTASANRTASIGDTGQEVGLTAPSAAPDDPPTPSEEEYAAAMITPPSMTEDEYARREVEITLAQLNAGYLKKTLDPKVDATVVMERAEKYARWRYRGYLRGEVASL
jgi:hypothetical protein